MLFKSRYIYRIRVLQNPKNKDIAMASASWADQVEDQDGTSEVMKSETDDTTSAMVSELEKTSVDVSANEDADLDVDAADKVVLPSAELNPESEDVGAKISTEKIAELDGRDIYKSAKSFEVKASTTCETYGVSPTSSERPATRWFHGRPCPRRMSHAVHIGRKM